MILDLGFYFIEYLLDVGGGEDFRLVVVYLVTGILFWVGFCFISFCVSSFS